MKLDRKWVSPMMAGGFLLIAVTGVVLFFHISTSFAKWSHEWLGMALIVVAIAHFALNWCPLKQQLKTKTGALLLIMLTITTVVSLIPLQSGSSSAPPFIAPMNALANQPLTTIAELSERNLDDIVLILTEQGLEVSKHSQTISDLTHGNVQRNITILGALFQTH